MPISEEVPSKMKAVIKPALRAALFLAIITVLLVASSVIVRPKSNAPGFGMHSFRANAITGEKADSLDVLFLGDSEAYCSFVPLKIWRDYGITSYVCATSGQKIYYTEEFLQKAFKTQSPKLVVLETDVLFRDFSRADALKNKVERVLPVIRYHNRWKTLNKSDFTLKTDYSYCENSKGYLYNAAEKPASARGYMTPSDERAVILGKIKSYVRKMKKFCDDRGATLILVSTPSTKNWNYKRHNATADFAAELGVSYTDLNEMSDALGINWLTDTRDKGDHLNYRGALKITAYVGKMLSDTGAFEDKRTSPDFASWNNAIDAFTAETGASLDTPTV